MRQKRHKGKTEKIEKERQRQRGVKEKSDRSV